MMMQSSPGDVGIADAGIARALEGLQHLDELSVADHVLRFNAVHESLTAALSSIDEV